MSSLWFLVALSTAVGPIDGTIAVLPPHSPDGAVLQGHDELVNGTAEAALERGMGVVDVDVVRDVLTTLASQNIRCIDPACFAQVGQFAGAKVVVVPVVDGRARKLLRIDAKGESLVLEVPVSSGETGVSAAIAWVLEGTPPPARLTVQGVAGAELWMNGVQKGNLPLEEPLALPSGRYELFLMHQGQEGAKQVLNLEPGSSTTIALDAAAVQKQTESAPVDSADEGSMLLLWSGLGVLGGAAAVAAVVAAASAAGYSARFLGVGAVPADFRMIGGVVGDAAAVSVAVVLVVGLAGGGALLVGHLVTAE